MHCTDLECVKLSANSVDKSSVRDEIFLQTVSLLRHLVTSELLNEFVNYYYITTLNRKVPNAS